MLQIPAQADGQNAGNEEDQEAHFFVQMSNKLRPVLPTKFWAWKFQPKDAYSWWIIIYILCFYYHVSDFISFTLLVYRYVYLTSHTPGINTFGWIGFLFSVFWF